MKLPEKDKRIWSQFFQGLLIFCIIVFFLYFTGGEEGQYIPPNGDRLLVAIGTASFLVALGLWLKYCIDSTNEEIESENRKLRI